MIADKVYICEKNILICIMQTMILITPQEKQSAPQRLKQKQLPCDRPCAWVTPGRLYAGHARPTILYLKPDKSKQSVGKSNTCTVG